LPEQAVRDVDLLKGQFKELIESQLGRARARGYQGRSPWLVGFGFVLIADKPYLLLVRLLVMLNALLG
jgi:hypothetical protein